MEQKNRKRGNRLILLTAFFWSFSGIATKVSPCHAMTVSGIMYLMSFLTMSLVHRKRKIVWNTLTVLTGTITALTSITFFIANKYTTVANAIVLQYCSPIFVVLYYRVFQHKRLKAFQLLAIASCFSGLLIFFSSQLGSGNMLGNVLALISGVLFGGAFYLNAKPENDPVATSRIGSLLCTVSGLAYTLCFARQVCTPGSILFLVITGTFINGFSAVTYAKGIQMTTALNANMIAMTEVLMAPLWSFLLFGENFGKQAGLGAALMIVSILFETWYESRFLSSEKGSPDEGKANMVEPL